MVKPPVMATSLQRLLFWSIVDTMNIDNSFNLSTMATFFCPQGGCCGEVELTCIASVSARVRREKLGQEQKKGMTGEGEGKEGTACPQTPRF